MPLTAEQYSRLMRFLDGAMNLEEMDEFEKELAENPKMREQLDFEQSIRNSLYLQEVTKLEESIPERPALAIWLGLVAALLAVVLLLPFLFRNTKENSIEGNENLVKQQQKDSLPLVTAPTPSPSPAAETAIPTAPGTELLTQLFKQFYTKEIVPDDYPVLLAEAFEDYDAGNYATFKKLQIDKLPATRGNNDASAIPTAYYFKGLSYLQTGNVGEAIRNLKWVITEQPDESLQEKAKWYLILCYLKDNNPDQAIALCRELKKTGKNQLLVRKSSQMLAQLTNKK